jgi:mono/diheme cytochrome c family protein
MLTPSRLACLVGFYTSAALAPAHAAAKLDFNRDIRPILSDNCFACHGPDTQKVKGGLRLDSREAALKPAKSGALAIVPGKPEKSALIERISTKAAADLMPPPESHKTLTTAQKDTLRRWVAEGANYSAHWAFVPPQRPSTPPIGNPIDAHLLARLKKNGLKFSPEADRPTLLRRAALDLTGIPPTPAEVDTFLADRSPNAYERAVDRLLASPRYGERMAMLWLDYARYADSHGFQTDSSRSMWPWRDWVIKAFNENMGFDQFTLWQLAGDLLPETQNLKLGTRNLDPLIATGFNRNHRINGEGGLIAEEWRVETIIDRVETTGTTWLGLTFNCCRCHDHKYDPITQREFYSFFAFFNSVEETGTLTGVRANRGGGNPEPTIHVTTPELAAKLAELNQSLQSAEAKRVEAEQQLPKLIEEWEPTFICLLYTSDAADELCMV